MRLIIAMAAFAGLMACSPQDVVSNAHPGRSSAHFDDYPTRLFDIFESTCSSPAQNFLKRGEHVYECREYLPPRPTAAAILGYDGYPEDLPQLVIRFSASQETPGYQVDAELFLNVPQRGGQAIRVVPADPRINRRMTRLLKKAGGTPR